MPFGRSDARLDFLSDCRASVVQHMRAFSCTQHVVSAIICWCPHSSGVDGDSGAKQGEFFGEQALQPAREPYRHTGTLPRSSGVAVAERVFPVLQRGLVPECSRDLIVAGRRRKSSASFGTPAIVRFDLSKTAIWYKPTWAGGGAVPLGLFELPRLSGEAHSYRLSDPLGRGDCRTGAVLSIAESEAFCSGRGMQGYPKR